MKNLMMLLVLALIAWGGYRHFQREQSAVSAVAPASASASSAQRVPTALRTPPAQQFKCDGRQHCSQMRSCEEATYFIQHCPNTNMDGDSDGVPCESQWCG